MSHPAFNDPNVNNNRYIDDDEEDDYEEEDDVDDDNDYDENEVDEFQSQARFDALRVIQVGRTNYHGNGTYPESTLPQILTK